MNFSLSFLKLVRAPTAAEDEFFVPHLSVGEDTNRGKASWLLSSLATFLQLLKHYGVFSDSFLL